MICGQRHEQKFKYPYPRDSKIIQMPYPRAKAIDQNPALCPASPAGLTLIGALSIAAIDTLRPVTSLQSIWMAAPQMFPSIPDLARVFPQQHRFGRFVGSNFTEQS